MSGGLPSLYAAWITELLAGCIPEEQAATCDACAMCGTGVGATVSFRPDLKCCTYTPELPNFIVGRILSDRHPSGSDGRGTILDRIRAGVCITPLGLGRPHALEQRYLDGSSEGFGRSPELRCPHYELAIGRCGIWQNRNAVCATWFCKHSRGAVGLRFWETLRDLLRVVEKALAQWCVTEMALPTGQAGWGPWFGRENEFYIECARRMGEPTWPTVLARSGVDVRTHSDRVRHAFQELTVWALPPRLTQKPLTVIRSAGSGRLTVSTYSGLDPLSVPTDLFTALRHFDGRPTLDALETIRSVERLDLSTRLVRKLVDFELLESASDE